MKKKIVFIVISILVIFGLLLLVTGGKMAGIMMTDYSVSEDGSVMTLKVGVASSMGYIRTLKEKQDGNKKYITFYSTFGLNSPLGAKDEFQIDLQPSCDEIYFYSGDGEFRLRLEKNSITKEWERAK